MKKLNLLLITLLFGMLLHAQENEIYYPTFSADTDQGFTKQHVVDHAYLSNIYKRVAGVPDRAELGYDDLRSAGIKALKCTGYDKNTSKIYKTNSYAIIDQVDLSQDVNATSFKVTFFNKSQYRIGDKGAIFNLLLSTEDVSDATTATWTNMNANLDTIDQDLEYDALWVKSTLDLTAYKGEKVTIAFQYLIEEDGIIEIAKDNAGEPILNVAGKDSILNRPGQWLLSDVRFTSSNDNAEPDMSEVMTQVQFNNWNLFHMVNVSSTNNQMWTRKSGLRAGLETPDSILITPEDSLKNPYKSISTSAVYTDNDLKSVSPVESWTILDSIDCSNYTNTKLSFWNLSKYKKGGDSDLAIKISTDYRSMLGDSVTAVNNATWTDITSSFVLDESIGYDSQWTKSEASIAGDHAKNLSIAFVYTSTETYSDVNGVNSDYRAATWSICDVMIKGVKDETSGLNTNKLKTINIYPNPTTGLVNFSQTIVSASIYTLQGQEVLTNNFTTQQLDASHLDKGIYFIKATTQDGDAVTARLIIR